MKRALFLATLLLLAAMPLGAAAQMVDPVKFSVATKRISPTEIDVTFTGKIQSGWHVYSTNIAADGPTPATFHLDAATGVEPVGALRAGSGAIRKHDPVFDAELEFFEHSCTFTQRLRITAAAYSARGYLEYGACSDASCMPPSTAEFSIKGTDGPAAAATADAATTAVAPTATSAAPSADTVAASAVAVADTAAAGIAAADSAALWAPQVDALASQNGSPAPSQRPLAIVFLLGLLGGFIALLTPCVWPIIPMTVSFFLHRGGSRRRAVRDAATYGLAIVVIYLGLGLAVTAIFGANAMNSLSTNAALNIFFFLLLLLFGASFLGGFDITLPSSWGNAVNSKSRQTSGLLSIFLMALTLVIVSFSCTGPIIGLLLVEVSSTGRLLAPAMGMLGFALALALPFSAFALFPAAMQRLPKSGGWMETVKVALGFVELAFSLKFLSVADLAYGWHLLDRETFLALWIALFTTAALWLFGVIGIHGEARRSASVPRLMLGMASLAFAVYMVPGLWGAPLKAISAFAPPMYTQDFRLGSGTVEAKYTSYEEGMAAARAAGKPALIDFTGYGCVNCRKMEAAVWTDPAVSRMLSNDFVLISLFTDDKQPLPTRVSVNVGGKAKTLRTVGDRWSLLQQIKFGANAQPFYVAVDAAGRPLAGSYAFDENPRHFEKFLRKALEASRKPLAASAD